MPENLSRRLRCAGLLLLAGSAVSRSLSVNRTIDDEKGDSVTGVVPSYSPVGSWSQGSTCDGCFIHLDISQAFDGTWHDATHTPGDPEPRVITAHFTGTAVYVYNALANTVPFTTTFTSITFTLDGTAAGQFVHVPTDSTDFQYNVPVFAKSGLSNTDHTIVIEANGATNSSLILFDYIVYTFEDDTEPVSQPASNPPPPPTSNPPPTTLPGTTAGGTTKVTSNPSSPSPLSQASSPNGASSPTASPGDTTPSSPNAVSSPPPATPAGIVSSSPSSSSAQTAQTVAPGSAHAVTSQNRSSVSVGAIAGGVVGGVVVVVAAVLTLCFIRKRRQAASPFAGEPEVSETRAVERDTVRNDPTFSGVVAQGGSNSVFVNPAPPSLTSLPTSRPSPQQWTTSSDLGSSTDGSSYTASGPGATRSGLTSALLATGTSAPSSARRVRPLPQPSISDSASWIGSGYAPPPPPAVSLSPNATGTAGTPDTGSAHANTATPPPLLAIPVDHKPPLADSAEEDPFAERPPSPSRTDLGSASSSIGTSTLRAQVAALQEEVERLREQQEMQRLFEEAPPEYHEA